MDKGISSVGTQYIICECGDNFPNERFLNIHLANNHGEVESFLCDQCPEAFTSNNSLSHHKRTHEKRQETPRKPEGIKTYTRKTPVKKDPVEKKPPVLKLKSLKRIDSISLIENLKSMGGFIKIEHVENSLEPEPDPEPPEATTSALEEATEEEATEEEVPVVVKNEAIEETEEIYYQCDVCNSIFYTEWDFNIHYQSKHALKLEPSAAELILEQHLASDHGVEAVAVKTEAEETAYYYECELCHKIFANEKYFNIHYNKTHSGVLLPVTEEDEIIEQQAQEEEPAPAPAPEPKPKAPEQVIYYKCDLCKILYPSEKAYNLHFDKKHGGQSCQEQTGFQLLDQELTEEYGEVPLEIYSCEYCSKTFTMKRTFQLHRKRAHGEQMRARAEQARSASRSKVCDVCGRAYNSNAALRYHQRRHTGEKPYACTICPKKFTMPMFLQIHMRTHTGERPYECPHCPKAFTNKAALIRHDRVHTGVKPYQCPECGKYFTQSNSMKLHVSTVHLKLPAPYKSKSRRHRSEARALQLALKSLPHEEELVLGE
ncbi:zinc finger protein 182-like [Leguminivora glycinivorella]|uniref:zinc finger protein 182-like n=1 Tax=Leguminivora glycinivorella TaxID=1035111 RepID=UPI00200D0AE8|nr:zinc finger protein 182-like [Leguminivora glycinivorella]